MSKLKTHDLSLWWGLAAAAVAMNRGLVTGPVRLDRAAKRCRKLALPVDYAPGENPFYRLFRLVRPPKSAPMVRDAIWRQLVVDAGFALDAELKRLTGEPAPDDDARAYQVRVPGRRLPPPQKPFRADIDG